MKKLAISTLAVLIACPAFAGHPHDGSSWQIGGMDPYIGLRGGIAYSNTNYSFLDSKESMTDLTFQGRVAMGLEIDKQYRSEIDWSIKSLGTGFGMDVLPALASVGYICGKKISSYIQL